MSYSASEFYSNFLFYSLFKPINVHSFMEFWTNVGMIDNSYFFCRKYFCYSAKNPKGPTSGSRRRSKGKKLFIYKRKFGDHKKYRGSNCNLISDKNNNFILQNPAISDIYTEHSCPVNVAKYSPSGFYIASGGKSINPFAKMPNFTFFFCRSKWEN